MIENVKKTVIEDDFLKSVSEYEIDNRIEFEACDSTLGDVMRWMAAYDEEEFNDKINKENYREYHSDSGMDMQYRYEHAVINGSGDLTYFGCEAGSNIKCKHGLDKNDKTMDYPLETPFIDIVCDYADNHWDEPVRVFSYYTGGQGLLAITVFSKRLKSALFSFGSLEMFGNYRAR